jgi:hypothetical protein
MKLIKKVVSKLIIFVSTLLARALAFLLGLGWFNIEPVHRIFRRSGFYFLRKHYYLPIPDEEDLGFARSSELPGVKMNDESQLQFTAEVVSGYKEEFAAFPLQSTKDPTQFFLVNGAFMAGDGNVYYALIRHLKPRLVIEVGSGLSTLLAKHALDRNKAQVPGSEGRLIAIEPYPSAALKKLALVELKACKLQEVDLGFFDQLGSGDILFIDSSHVLKSGGDVWLEYCEIIPRLKTGVYVHVHDISLPKPYPKVYYDQQLYWNEQYLLQALLTNNDHLEVVWAGTYLFDRYPQIMKALFSPEYEQMREVYPLAEPSSFWMRVK